MLPRPAAPSRPRVTGPPVSHGPRNRAPTACARPCESCDPRASPFPRHGLKKVSLNDITKRLGVAKTAIYYHFPRGKLAITDAALEQAEAKVLEAMRRAVERERDPRRQLRALILARIAHLEELRQVLEVTGEVAEEFTELYERRERRFNEEEQALLEAILRRGWREGLVGRANVGRLARYREELITNRERLDAGAAAVAARRATAVARTERPRLALLLRSLAGEDLLRAPGLPSGRGRARVPTSLRRRA